MRVNFNPDSIDWQHFFLEPQVGGAYFKGRPYMHGAGFFGAAARLVLPILKKIGIEIGKEGLSAGSRILGDIVKGDKPLDAVNTHLREGAKNLADKASASLQKGSGNRKKRKKQNGRGQVVHTYNVSKPKKRKHKATHPIDPFEGRRITNFSSSKNKPPKKRRKLQHFDSLGPY